MGLEENLEAIPGLEMYLQGGQDGGLDEVVFFPGTADQRVAEDSKHLKRTVRKFTAEN
jgi:hypothetical protein